MQPLPVIFDCDPGKDDALALFVALALPGLLDVLAVTTVAGNVPVAQAAENARRVVEAAGCAGMPVYSGCARPMLRTLETAERVHGRDGLGGSGLPTAVEAVERFHGVSALIGFLDEAVEPLTVAAIGPLTNIAMVLIARPDLACKIRHLVVMGGARDKGNVTEHAEFNIHVDPHAAHVALSVDAPVSLVTLDITGNLCPPPEWFEAMEGFGAPGRAVAGMWRQAPVALHDVTVTGLLAWPDLFTLEPCTLSVICDDRESRIGQTVIETGDGSCHVVTALEVETLLDRVFETMRSHAT